MNKVTYLDHCGYIVTTDDVILVFDYYRDPSHSLHKILEQNAGKPVVFFVTGYHKSHYNRSIFDLAQNHSRTYVMSNDVLLQNVPDTLAVAGMSKGDLIENLPGGLSVKAYGGAYDGLSFLVTTKDGKRIFHAGELNDWHNQDNATMKEVHESSDRFRAILNRFASEVNEVDILFFPVDASMGSDYARGAREFMNAVKVKDFFPTHLTGEVNKSCDFVSYAPSDVSCHCVHIPGESITL